MMRTDLIGDELSSGFRFLAELSLYGTFFLIPENLFFRRSHDKSSSWERTSMDHQRAYCDPERNTKYRMHAWRRHVNMLCVVSRAPIGGKE
jgi:hypothetical protein